MLEWLLKVIECNAVSACGGLEEWTCAMVVIWLLRPVVGVVLGREG